jgi:hypothetical protein
VAHRIFCAAQSILCAVAFFPVPGYAGAVATGALNFYRDWHDFIVFLCALFVSTPLSYFVDRHPIKAVSFSVG